MSITAERKSAVIKEYARSEGDTGSVEVQVAVLTERINNLTAHLQGNKHDFSSRRGLLMLVGRRRSLLTYLHGSEEARYLDLIKRLNLRK